MHKLFQIIRSKNQASIGFVAAAVAFIVAPYLHEKVSIPLQVVALPIGAYCFSYLLINIFVPAAVAGAQSSYQWCVQKLSKAEPEEERPSLQPSQSASFFAERFSTAFPGVRKPSVYDGNKAVKRLEPLLAKPLVFKNGDGYTTPIWWWRDGNLQIYNFKVLSRTLVLINSMEIQVNRIVAVPGRQYFRSFVYLEAKPMKPARPKDWNDERWQGCLDLSGYVREEYAVYKKKHMISRAEYDDNAAFIRGKIRKLGKDVELRERYLTPFNMVIAPHLSPINNTDFDSELVDILNGILREEKTVEDLQRAVEKLPKPRMWDAIQ
ncbi:MAG: hypothetical protein MI794_04765 [Pseudomonadales bacterium]|nr:hypothetical protein [Pseudomonadales bacterium]